MSGNQSKLTTHAKKPETMSHNEKNVSIGTHPVIAQMTELVDKNIEIFLITLFHMFQKLEEKIDHIET